MGGKDLPAKADLSHGLELSWVEGREPGVSPSLQSVFTS